ncbi:hypothetical protein N0O92_17625 [Alkalihalobacillus sp. MEB130]|uniref:hypothetical protein n=1 Tax=Alkalihalobacillus sp. MEB130 TaxID=2976704 RepID=UPI0028DF5429|nr:hypothetical protein [Alkalihalobacillus sp. MEB130]MDT8862033.1 hypothetical protein [Alkalihalobacillus sp. MEB130]
MTPAGKRGRPLEKIFLADSGKCNGFTRCAPATRNPLVAGLKEGNGSAHCLKATKKGENRTFFSRLESKCLKRNATDTICPSALSPFDWKRQFYPGNIEKSKNDGNHVGL